MTSDAVFIAIKIFNECVIKLSGYLDSDQAVENVKTSGKFEKLLKILDEFSSIFGILAPALWGHSNMFYIFWTVYNSIAIVHYSSSCWILHDFHRMVQRIKADMLLTWDVGFVELVQHQQVELVGVGVAHHAGHGHDGGHRLTEGSLSRRQGSAWTSYVTALLGPIITWTSTQTLGHQWIVI